MYLLNNNQNGQGLIMALIGISAIAGFALFQAKRFHSHSALPAVSSLSTDLNSIKRTLFDQVNCNKSLASGICPANQRVILRSRGIDDFAQGPTLVPINGKKFGDWTVVGVCNGSGNGIGVKAVRLKNGVTNSISTNPLDYKVHPLYGERVLFDDSRSWLFPPTAFPVNAANYHTWESNAQLCPRPRHWLRTLVRVEPNFVAPAPANETGDPGFPVGTVLGEKSFPFKDKVIDELKIFDVNRPEGQRFKFNCKGLYHYEIYARFGDPDPAIYPVPLDGRIPVFVKLSYSSSRFGNGGSDSLNLFNPNNNNIIKRSIKLTHDITYDVGETMEPNIYSWSDRYRGNLPGTVAAQAAVPIPVTYGHILMYGRPCK